MRKEWTLKYLILTFMMMISFFVFSSIGVSAENVSFEIKDNLYVELEEVQTGNPAAGYNIVGSSYACEVEQCSFSDVVIPDVYSDGENSYPIVGIANGDILTGALNDIASVVEGKIWVGYRVVEDGEENTKISEGTNLETIGVCAFCGFEKVSEIELASSVTLVDINAFSGSGVKNLIVNRYDPLDFGNEITQLRSEVINNEKITSLSGMVLENVVLNNSAIDKYKETSVWSDIDASKFTYRIEYKFYIENDFYESRVYFAKRELGDIPSIPTELQRKGFNYNGWLSTEFSKEEPAPVTSDSKANVNSGDLIHEVYADMELIVPNVEMSTIYAENKMYYAGKDTSLNITVDVRHVLKNEEEFRITYAWKSNIGGIVETIANTSNEYGINFVNQSGKYICTVTIAYDGYSYTNDYWLNVEIMPREITVFVNDNQTEYGTYVGPKKIDNNYFNISKESYDLVLSESIKAYEVKEYTASESNIKVGTYEDVLEVIITNIGYSDDDTNYLNNYKITYDYGDLTVVAKSYDINLYNNKVIEYGDEENLTSTIKDVVYGNIENTISVTYSRSNETIKDVGEYIYRGVTSNNSNYNFTLKDNGYKFIIEPKKVNVDWVIDEDLVYDGREKSVSASYKDNSNVAKNLNVTIKKNGEESLFANAGVYSVVASEIIKNRNYELVNFEKEIEIEKAESVFTQIVNQVTYNGFPQRIEITLNHNEKQIQYGSYVNCVNVGKYQINAKVDASENYKANSMDFSLEIKPVTLNVEPDLFEITYGTKSIANYLTKKINGVNGEELVVSFVKGGNSNEITVGSYNIINVDLNKQLNPDIVVGNYSLKLVENSGLNKIKIVPASIEVRCVFCEHIVYDGKVREIGKDIGITYEGTDEDIGLTVTVEGNKVIQNAGTYKLNLSLSNDNYYIAGDDYFIIDIAKADYNVSGLKLNDKKVSFNFKNHFINLEGELPEGLHVTYTIDDNKGNGTFAPFKHTVKVTFVGDFENYNYVEPLTATLNVSMTWVWIVLSLIIALGGGGTFAILYLIRERKIVFRRRVNFAQIIKRNRELDAVNEIIMNARIEMDRKKNGDIVEEETLIEDEPVKFVKNPVKVPQEETISLSFVDKLFKSEYGTKQCYSEVKNELLSYEGVVSKIKRDYETFFLNNVPIARFSVEDGELFTYFALDPSQYKTEEYNHVNASKEKDFVAVPLKLKVNSIVSLRHAKMFVRIIRKREGIKSVSNYIKVDYVKVYTAKENNSMKLFKKVFMKKGKEGYDDLDLL